MKLTGAYGVRSLSARRYTVVASSKKTMKVPEVTFALRSAGLSTQEGGRFSARCVRESRAFMARFRHLSAGFQQRLSVVLGEAYDERLARQPASRASGTNDSWPTW
jgi:hypothetical protein